MKKLHAVIVFTGAMLICSCNGGHVNSDNIPGNDTTNTQQAKKDSSIPQIDTLSATLPTDTAPYKRPKDSVKTKY